MSETTTTKPVTGLGTAAVAPSGLSSEHGVTTIADTVVSKIAGIAARDVSGVHALGGGAARAVGALRERIPGGRVNHSQGVSVEVGERQAAVDIELIAEYGVAISDLASAVRRNVIASVERMTGLEVTEVNLEVSDVHLPEEDDDEPEVRTTRVQ
ncbi:Asp23/Gls24 family envelope stress response protein [Kineococcus rhizosphaerae]|uniref:Putative alkaline shock family protein YloU n=1 Tax=Kineococcus rhizosphaerae TaxID=559628 RepID=A0A2T0R193_9ACTN|nr:Asp23/Gls24 family envelope stress response protein [Kineococcus rhizosphaerae]PRY13036.1 putative alkaline shock family protein YloU [Kineococcus rhizosphaerae]